MISIIKSTRNFAALAMTLMLVACASTGSGSQDVGERMLARGASISGRGADWTAGQRDVDKGQKQLRKNEDRAVDGENDLRKAKDAVARAEQQIQKAQAEQLAAHQQIDSGTAKMRQAEADYGQIRQQQTVVPPR